jgi:hypothetical protein
VSLKDVVAAWESGDKDLAVAHFLSVRWDDASVFRDIRAFNISEQQFVSLPEDQRRPIMQQAMDVARSVRALAKHMTVTAETLAASDDVEKARIHCDAVMQCGRSWQAPERLEVIRMVGKAMVTLAQNKLSTLK